MYCTSTSLTSARRNIQYADQGPFYRRAINRADNPSVYQAATSEYNIYVQGSGIFTNGEWANRFWRITLRYNQKGKLSIKSRRAARAAGGLMNLLDKPANGSAAVVTA